MADFLLIHGAWHSASCWNSVISELKMLGHRAVAVNLPGRHNDSTDPRHISVQTHANSIRDALSRLTRPTLIAHSLSGFWAAQAVEDYDGQLDWLVFLCAYVPVNGKTAVEIAPLDPEGEVHDAIVVDPEAGTSSLDESHNIQDLLYGHCDTSAAKTALAQLRPEPIRPATEPITLSDDHFHATKKAYIECLRDRVISIGYQRRMQKHTSFDRVLTMDSDHSPFFSHPEQLSLQLAKLAES